MISSRQVRIHLMIPRLEAVLRGGRGIPKISWIILTS